MNNIETQGREQWHIDERVRGRIPKWASQAHEIVHRDILRSKLKHVGDMKETDIMFFSAVMVIPLPRNSRGLYWRCWTKRFKETYACFIRMDWINVETSSCFYTGPAANLHPGILVQLHQKYHSRNKMSYKKPGQTKKAKTAKRKKPSQSHPETRKVTAKMQPMSRQWCAQQGRHQFASVRESRKRGALQRRSGCAEQGLQQRQQRRHRGRPSGARNARASISTAQCRLHTAMGGYLHSGQM